MKIADYISYWIHRAHTVAFRGPEKLGGGRFFKFRPIGEKNSTEQNRLRETITNQTIYFARPSTFNDPFECHPRVSIGYSKSRFRSWVTETISNHPHGATLTPEHRGKVTENAAAIQLDASIRNKIFHQIVDDSTAIYSMSKSCENMLQWSYYADSHKGICLQFDIDGENFCDSQLYEVEYVGTRHIFDVVEASNNSTYRHKATLRGALTKSKAWEHEREVRAIRITSEEVQYPSTALTGIGFGLRTTDQDKRLVREWVEKSGHDLQLFEMADNPVSFGLTRNDI